MSLVPIHPLPNPSADLLEGILKIHPPVRGKYSVWGDHLEEFALAKLKKNLQNRVYSAV